jgi:glycogen synthase
MPSSLTRTSPRHVLMTTDAVGGVWRHAVDLAAGLSRAMVRVTLVALGPAPARDQSDEVAALPGVDLKVTNLPLDWTASTAGELAAASRRISEIAGLVAADVIHLNGAAFAADGDFEQPVVVVHHSCLATWWDAMRSDPLPEDFRWRTEHVARGLSAAERVVAPSGPFAAAVASRYGLKRSPVVVENGTAIIGRDVAATRERVVLSAGRFWDEAKGLVCLDAAAAGLDAQVLVAGDLQGPGAVAPAPHHITVLGRLDRTMLKEEYARAGVFVSLARYEPFGLAVLEAAASGCPLVLSDIPTFRNLWDGAAIFVDPSDTAAVRQALHLVLDDPAEAERLAGAARLRARRFTLQAMTDGFLSAYADALVSSGHRHREAHA